MSETWLFALVGLYGLSMGLRWLWGRHRQRRFDVALSGLKTLERRPIPHLDARVHGFYAYGAIDISAQHALVWLLLEGEQSQLIPPWYDPDEPHRSDGLTPPDAVRDGLRDLAQEVKERMRAAGYDWSGLRVMVESVERVRVGGWFYFK